MARDMIARDGRGRVRTAVDTIELIEQPGKWREYPEPRSAAPPVECSVGVVARCARVAPILLTQLNLVLAMLSGGALVTAARLAWDPTTYVPVRALFPVEYRVSTGVLTATGSMLVVLAHIAVVALAIRRRSARRVLLILYVLLMCALAAMELAWCVWMVRRLLAWLNSGEAALIANGLQVIQKGLKPILKLINMWTPKFLKELIPLPQQIYDVMEEVDKDVPINMYAVIAGGVLLAVAQALSVLLALVLTVC